MIMAPDPGILNPHFIYLYNSPSHTGWKSKLYKAIMSVNYCMPVIPSANLEKSLRFWTVGLGLTADREMREDGRLVGCMVHKEGMFFWLNQRAGEPIPSAYEGVRFYWTPDDLFTIHQHFKQLGYEVSPLENREYGNTEFFLTDDDGYAHCFGVATDELSSK